MKYDLPDRYSPKNLLAEYESDRRYWRIAVDLHADCVRKAAGEMYYGNRTAVAQPENYHYTYTVHTKARLTQGTMLPRFTAKKSGESERVKAAQEFCTDWAIDVGLMVEFERLVDDMCFGGAVAIVTQAKRRGYEQMDDGPRTPMVSRIPMTLWGCDPVGGTLESARHMWHACVEIKTDFVAYCRQNPDEWDIEVVERLVAKPLADVRGIQGATGVDRKEITYVTFWARDYNLPFDNPVWKTLDRAKCHGTVIRFGVCESLAMEVPELLGPPVPFFGPRSGPYVYDGFTDVPGETRKSSPLIACGGLIEELNATERAIDVLANNAKTGIFVDGLTPQGENAIQQFQHGEVVRIAGFTKENVVAVQIGGPPVELLLRARELAAKVRRNLGMPDTALGEVDGSATLGENEIANSHLELNTEAMDARAKRVLGAIYLKAAWYGENDTRTVVQQDGNTLFGGQSGAEHRESAGRAREARMISQEEHDEFVDGLPDDNEQVAFEDLSITVEGVKRDPASLARFMQATDFVASVLPFAALADPEGLQKFMERGADELRVSEVANLLSSDAVSQMPIPGAETEEQRTAPAQEPRKVSAQTISAAQKKPQKTVTK